MLWNKKGKRFADDEMDEDGSLQEGNPHARRPRKTRHTPRVPRWVYRVIIILIICVSGMLIWFNRENLTPQNIAEWVQVQVVGMGVGDGFPTAIAGNSISPGNFESQNHNIAYVSDTRLTVLNSTAKELISRQHSFNSPVMKLSGTRTLIYNLGGTGYQVESASKTLKTGNMEKDILAGDICSNGRYALVTEEKGYTSLLTVWLEDNTEQYRFEFADFYITSLSLNRDGTKAAASGISAQNGGLVSVVYLFDFSQETETAKLLYPDTLILDVEYCENGTVIAIGDSSASFISGDGSAHTEFSYGSQQLTDYIVDSGRLYLGFSPYSGAQTGTVAVVDSNGQAVQSFSFQTSVESVSAYGDIVGVLAGQTVYAYSVTTGQLSGSCSSGSDARKISLANESSVYILGITEIRLGSLS